MNSNGSPRPRSGPSEAWPIVVFFLGVMILIGWIAWLVLA